MSVELAQTAAPFWPVSVSAWLSLLGAIVALLSVAVGYGRIVQQINGLGMRVAGAEKDDETTGVKVGNLEQQTTRILDQHELLIKSIGESRGEGIRCREDYLALNEALGGKLNLVRKEMYEQNAEARERLAAIEGQLREMRKPTENRGRAR